MEIWHSDRNTRPHSLVDERPSVRRGSIRSGADVTLEAGGYEVVLTMAECLRIAEVIAGTSW